LDEQRSGSQLKVGEVIVGMRLALDELQKSFAQARTMAKKAGDALEEAFSSRYRQQLKKMQDDTKDATSKMSGYFKDVSRVVSGILISQAFYATLSAIKDATRALIEFNSQLELSAIKFEVLTGSAREARAFMRAVEDFAVRTPFTYADIDLAASRFKAYGFAIEEVIPLLRIVGDVTAGLGGGKDVLNGIVRALGQIRATGKVQKEELRQLADWGVPALEILQEELGLTAEQVANIGNLDIPASIGLAALFKGMDARYGGIMEKMERTTVGARNAIQEFLLLIGRNVFQGPLNSLREGLLGIRDRLEELWEVTRTSGAGGLFEALVPPEMRTSVRIFLSSLKSIGQSLGRLWKAAQPIVKAFGTAFAAALAIITPLVALLAEAISRMAEIITRATPLVNALVFAIVGLRTASLVVSAVTGLAAALRMLASAAASSMVVKQLHGALVGLWAFLKRNPITMVVVVLAGALLTISGAAKNATQWIDTLMKKFGQLLGFNPDEILQPTDPEQIADDLSKYNQSLQDIIDGMKGTEEATEDAEAATKKFLAAFDEVYNIPEQEKSSWKDGFFELPDFPSGPGSGTPSTPDAGLPGEDSSEDSPWLFWIRKLEKGANDAGRYLQDLRTRLQNEFAKMSDAVVKFSTQFVPVFEGTFAPLPGLLTELNLSEVWGGVLQTLQSVLVEFSPGFQVEWGSLLQGLLDSVVAFQTNLKVEWEKVLQGLLDAIPAFTPGFAVSWGAMLQALIDKIVEYDPSFDVAWDSLLQGLLLALIAFTPVLSLEWGTMFDGMKLKAETIAEEIKAAWATFLGELEALTATAKENISTTWESMREALGLTTAVTSEEVQTAWDEMLQNLLNATTVGMLGLLPALWGMSGAKINELTDTTVKDSLGIWGGLLPGLALVVSEIPGLFGSIESPIKTLMKNTAQAVADTFYNMAVGVRDMIQSLANSMAALTGNRINVGSISRPVVGGSTAPSLSLEDWKEGLTSIGSWFKEALTPKGSPATSPSTGSGGINWDSLKDWSTWTDAWTVGLQKDNLETAKKWLEEEMAKPQNSIPLGLLGGLIAGGSLLKLGKSAGSLASWWDEIVAGLQRAVTGFASGGIVGRDSIIRVGERGRREAIVPLETSAMMPFADAVANGVAEALEPLLERQSYSTSDARPQLYVHTLIADERSLKELYRKMEVIRIAENERKGLT